MMTGVKDKFGVEIQVGDVVRTTHDDDKWRGVQEFEILPRLINADCIWAKELRSGPDAEHLTENTYKVTLSFGVWNERPNLEIINGNS